MGEKVETKIEIADRKAPAMQVFLGPNLLTRREEMGPTSMMNPARILPTCITVELC
mgnify:CR=1 FL=1